jgi:hypothetical protein
MRYSTSYADPGLKMGEHLLTAPGKLVIWMVTHPSNNWPNAAWLCRSNGKWYVQRGKTPFFIFIFGHFWLNFNLHTSSTIFPFNRYNVFSAKVQQKWIYSAILTLTILQWFKLLSFQCTNAVNHRAIEKKSYKLLMWPKNNYCIIGMANLFFDAAVARAKKQDVTRGHEWGNKPP